MNCGVRLLLVLIVTVGALILSVGLVGNQAANDVRETDERARMELNRQLRGACARLAARDFEAVGRDRDIRLIAARLGDDAIVDRASARSARVRLRLPVSEGATDVGRHCRALYPVPTPR